jgi:hypothetical protein
LIGGAGHSPNVERPARTARLVLEFADGMAATKTVELPASRGIVAECDSAAVEPGRADWRRSSHHVVGRFGISAFTPSRIRGVLIAKAPVTVAGRRPVTMRVNGTQPRQVGFLYGRLHEVDSVAEAASQVTFRLCTDKPRTFWPGAIALAEPGPFTVHVRQDARAPALRITPRPPKIGG